MLSLGYRMPPPKDYYCPEDVYTKMRSCWDSEPTRRPSFKELHVFFSKYKFGSSDYYNMDGTDHIRSEDFDNYVVVNYEDLQKLRKQETKQEKLPMEDDDTYEVCDEL